ncbi:MAG: hypothetical protein KY447_12665 [Actinobacteria bacterium]|nr:hypothetical protein [Actinomycetota bacterium]
MKFGTPEAVDFANNALARLGTGIRSQHWLPLQDQLRHLLPAAETSTPRQ